MTAHLALIILAALGVWAVRAWLWPFTPCRRCQGAKTNPGSTSRRWGACRACKGTGSRQVLGSRALHKAVRSLASSRRKK